MFNFALTTGRVGSTCSIWLTGFDFLREFHCKDFVHQWFLFNCRASTLLYDILLCFLVVEIDDITAERWSSLPFRSDSSTTQLKQFWSRYVTGQNYKVSNAKVPNDNIKFSGREDIRNSPGYSSGPSSPSLPWTHKMLWTFANISSEVSSCTACLIND